jgi:hypothetical protein
MIALLRRIGRALWAISFLSIGLMLLGGSTEELVVSAFLFLNALLLLLTLLWAR